MNFVEFEKLFLDVVTYFLFFNIFNIQMNSIQKYLQIIPHLFLDFEKKKYY